jgi:hypothetical protein
MLWKLDTRAGLWPGNQAHAVVAEQRLDPGNRERATVNHHHREALQQVAGGATKASGDVDRAKYHHAADSGEETTLLPRLNTAEFSTPELFVIGSKLGRE